VFLSLCLTLKRIRIDRLGGMRINLYGGPCVGKSALAFNLCGRLRQEHYPIELVTEYIKNWAYEKRTPDNWDQLYIFAKQHRKEKSMYASGVKHLITDSPLLLQIAYARKYHAVGAPELFELAKKWEHQ
jgi:Ni2+-binding GTPase involved in maturation of urease and hydrogenase